MKIRKSIVVSLSCPSCGVSLEMPDNNEATTKTEPIKKKRARNIAPKSCGYCGKFFTYLKPHIRYAHLTPEEGGYTEKQKENMRKKYLTMKKV